MLTRVPLLLALPRWAVLSLVLAVVLALSGCGGDDQKVAEPRSTPSATPTLSSSATPTPSEPGKPSRPKVTKPERPAFKLGKAGQEAFAEYVVQVWVYSLATNDATLLRKVSLGGRPCQGCARQAKTVAQREKEGWSVYPFEVTVERIRLIRTAMGTTARVRVDIPQTRSFFDNGDFRNDSPAHADAVFTISMRQVGKQYRLVGFTLE